MLLDLIALRCPPPDQPHSIKAQFGVAGGVIGRSRNCALPLPDPSQQISRRHVEIRFRNGEFSLKVVSETNGIQINDTFVQPGAAMPLADGDRIQIGDYEFRSSLVSAAAVAPDPFDALELFGGAPVSTSTGDYWALSASPTAPAKKRDVAEESMPTSKLQEAFTDIEKLGAFGTVKEVASAPLSDMDLDQLFSSLSGAPVLKAEFTRPDFDLGAEFTEVLNPGVVPRLPNDKATVGGAARPAMPEPARGADVFSALDDLTSNHDSTVPLPVLPRARSTVREDLVAASVRVAPVPSAASPPTTPDGIALIRVLAQSLGLEPGALDESKPEATIKVAGEMLRLALEGVHRLLEMRAELKGELGVEDRTTIKKAENNPLKQTESLAEALGYLLDVRQHGNRLFMSPARAVEDAVWDICAHEMALMAGMRSALLASLKLFSPEVVEGRIKKSGALNSVLPTFYKSKLWDQFLAMYGSLQREAEDHFDKLLNHEFAKAYGEQSKKLRKKAPKTSKLGGTKPEDVSG